MANAYCTIDQLGSVLDARVLGELGNDDGSATANAAKVQELLDMAASELESYLNGRWPLPLTAVPKVLTRWVAVKTVELLYGNRTDLPQAVKDQIEWSDKWIDLLMKGLVSLPSQTRQGAVLQQSDRRDGSSRFDSLRYFDRPRTV